MKQLYILFAFIAFSVFAQQTTATAQNTEQATLKYVRINIGHGGLHCPFLGPQLEKKLKEMGNVSNMQVYRQESYATFELPATMPVTDADIRQVAIKVGYPDADVSVVVSDTAPINQQ
jgi:hypothetical protein